MEYLNVGETLSKEIEPIISDKRFSMKSKDVVQQLFVESIREHNDFGKYLALGNIGILFEKDLKISFHFLIESFSKNNILIINWPGEIENNKIYFLSKKNGVELSLDGLSHIIL